jgi:hypothetical protein
MPANPPTHRYRETVLRELERRGIRPRPTTSPERLHGFLNDLYVFEIRELKLRRDELERFFGPQPLGEYAAQVQALRHRYPLLSLPLPAWIEDEAS